MYAFFATGPWGDLNQHENTAKTEEKSLYQ